MLNLLDFTLHVFFCKVTLDFGTSQYETVCLWYAIYLNTKPNAQKVDCFSLVIICQVWCLPCVMKQWSLIKDIEKKTATTCLTSEIRKVTTRKAETSYFLDWFGNSNAILDLETPSWPGLAIPPSCSTASVDLANDFNLTWPAGSSWAWVLWAEPNHQKSSQSK